ncbi:MAG: GDP-mannose 4,6-dehydratase [Patescibacteria group bacterium]
MKQKVLITGGTGFVGNHLTELLLKSTELEIHATSFGSQISQVNLPASQVRQIDLTDFLATKQLLTQLQPDQIYHLAAITTASNSFAHASKILLNNVELQLNFFQVLTELKSQARILVVGSADEYGLSQPGELPITEEHPLRPINPYAVSKIAQDMLAYAYGQAQKLDVIRARPFNHIGPGQVGDFAVSAFAKQIALIEVGKQNELLVGNLKAKRDFSDVEDVVKAYQLLMSKGEPGQVYNIGSGQSVSMEWILNELIALAKVKIEVREDPARLRSSDTPEMVADISKITELGFKIQVPLKQSLARVLDYWRKQV